MGADLQHPHHIPTVSTPAHLRDLNPEQRKAVETLEGPVLVLAGAGTGKTRVLVNRINHIFFEGKAWPSEVLAVTFTNRAANEMRERIAQHSAHMGAGLWIGTFHSIGARILRRHAPLLGYSERFNIIDTEDQLRLIKQIFKDKEENSSKELCKQMLGYIESWKDRGLRPEQVKDHPGDRHAFLLALEVYKIYQRRLQTLDAMDFGDLLLNCLILFKEHPHILQGYQNQFKYILIDEYQDTNIAQYLWLRLLAQASKNICCVGDDDQSIYGWRGAEVGNILRFEKDFPGATVIRLEQNYRSTEHILAAASALIEKNQSRLGKKLWTEAIGGEKVHLKSTWDAKEEARWVAEEIESLQRQNVTLSSIAILMRAGFQTREFEECFLKMAISHRIVGGFRFYERQEIRDAIAYMRLISQNKDGLAFERIINVPKRGIGTASLQKMHAHARTYDLALAEAAQDLLRKDDLKGKTKAELEKFFSQLENWRTYAQTNTLENLLKYVLDTSGYKDFLRQQNSLEAQGRLENLRELAIAMREFETLESFLEHVSLVMENVQKVDYESVTLMTMHSAKGLEFDYVFLAGWEEGVFPSERSTSDPNDIEEERRLGYVGLTRARKKAHISFALNRQFFGQWSSSGPSRFIAELPPENIEELPGSFQRLRGGYADTFQPSPSYTTYASPASSFSLGERVFHIKFGYGVVTQISGPHVSVTFAHSGPKKILEDFLQKTS